MGNWHKYSEKVSGKQIFVVENVHFHFFTICRKGKGAKNVKKSGLLPHLPRSQRYETTLIFYKIVTNFGDSLQFFIEIYSDSLKFSPREVS